MKQTKKNHFLYYTVNTNPKKTITVLYETNKKNHFLYKYKGEINIVYHSRISLLCMLTLLIGSARIHLSQSTYNPGGDGVSICIYLMLAQTT